MFKELLSDLDFAEVQSDGMNMRVHQRAEVVAVRLLARTTTSRRRRRACCRGCRSGCS